MNKPFRIVLTFLFIAYSFIAHAQRGNQTSISIGTELDVPLNMGDYPYDGPDVHYHGGFGINVKLEKPISRTLHFTVNTGFVYFETNPRYLYNDPATDYLPGYYYNEPYNNPYVYIPLTAGLKYYCLKYFYVSAEAGSAFKTNNKTNTSFIYSGGAGAVVPIGPHHGLDFGLRYERGYKNIDYDHVLESIGVNVAYKYRF